MTLASTDHILIPHRTSLTATRQALIIMYAKTRDLISWLQTLSFPTPYRIEITSILSTEILALKYTKIIFSWCEFKEHYNWDANFYHNH